MKRVLSGIFTALIISITTSPTYAADMQLKVEDVIISSDVKPEINNNRTMVPLRVISENLGARLNRSDSEIVLTKSNMKVILQLNSKSLLITPGGVTFQLAGTIEVGNMTF